MSYLNNFDPLPNRVFIDASAGTGKTWTVVAIVTRELALRDDLRVGNLLVTTYTRNAAAELRDRLRRRLAETARALLEGLPDPEQDPLIALLQRGNRQEVIARAQRLQRAGLEFDSATITTIHGVCSRVLRAAGMENLNLAEQNQSDAIISQAVNDSLLMEAARGNYWDQPTFTSLVKKLASDPLLEPWFDTDQTNLTDKSIANLEQLKVALESCRGRIHREMRSSPAFDDLLRLAWEMTKDPANAGILSTLRARFRLAIVDEAQDTNSMQWEFLDALFPGADDRPLVSVGDPKQAIYGFRGADVSAYIRVRSRHGQCSSLTANRRSDGPLITSLNQLMQGCDFGNNVSYARVDSLESRQASMIENVESHLALLDIGDASNQNQLVSPVVKQVVQLLETARLRSPQNPDGPAAELNPKDICVLVKSNAVGQAIQKGLASKKIPAVTAGTSSVMESQVGVDFLALLEAMERPSSNGRMNRAAATVFFGHSLVTSGALSETSLNSVREQIVLLSAALSKKGFAQLGGVIESNDSIMTRIVSGTDGERNLTDLLHLIEALESVWPNRGCPPEKAIELYSQLAKLRGEHELVSRRVESDADAVKICTIFAAKGLEFPCVIVADLWKVPDQPKGGSVFRDATGAQKIDIGIGLKIVTGSAASEVRKNAHRNAEIEELKRLLYVALTRAQHYLAVLIPSENPGILQLALQLPKQLATVTGEAPNLTRQFLGGHSEQILITADLPTVVQTWRKVSFTGLTAARHRRAENAFGEVGAGHDETDRDLTEESLSDETATAMNLEVIEIPAGISVGTWMHKIFEHLQPESPNLEGEVRRVVQEYVTSGRLVPHRGKIEKMVLEAVTTPLGKLLGDLRLTDFAAHDRLPELDFECGLASLTRGVHASELGKVLKSSLPESDLLYNYASFLAQPAFDIPVGGLLNGSIDAVLRLPNRDPRDPRLLICDYKSNRLHRLEDRVPLNAYAPSRLLKAMEESHYPLQALLYGTALFRLLRWRLGQTNPESCIEAIVYGFIRGMKGPDTPVDERSGARYGVFVWKAPSGLWPKLSDLLSGKSQTSEVA